MRTVSDKKDIVERLRRIRPSDRCELPPEFYDVLTEAADEIEKLRKKVDDLERGVWALSRRVR